MNFIRTTILGLFIFLVQDCYSQITISGMVVDSVTMQAVPAANIRLKHAKKGVIANEKGIFMIFSDSYDTIVISRIGYKSYEYPFFGTEKDLLFLIREEVLRLKEVVVNFYSDEKVVHTKPREIRALTLGDAFNSPFTYFSKTEKEKRTLVKMRAEYSRVQVYVDLVTSVKFRIETMEKFNIDEDHYYDILAKFNEEKRSVQYLTDEIEIINAIHSYFESQPASR
jgi:hypothetical protein